MDERLGPVRELTQHFEHQYVGLHGHPSSCHIAIFQGEHVVPIVIATQLPQHTGDMMTAMMDYIAAEVLTKHLPERIEEEMPMLWIEYYPKEENWSHRRWIEQDIVAGFPDFSLIPFASFKPGITYFHVKRVKIESAANPDYTYTRIPLTEDEVARLLRSAPGPDSAIE